MIFIFKLLTAAHLTICSPFANGRGPVGGHSLLKREPLPTVVPMRFLAPFGPPIAALPRKRLAFSAAGSAAPLSPQPPEEKPGGVSTSPPDPLTTQRRGIAIPLLWKHPPKRGERQRKEEQLCPLCCPSFERLCHGDRGCCPRTSAVPSDGHRFN